jgi:hypothetical protein
MTRHHIPLGRILGIPIGLDYSWFVIFALLTWMLADNYYPAEFRDWPPLLYWFMGAVTAVMLFVSVLLHRFSLCLDHFGLLLWIVTARRAATTTTPRRPSGAGGGRSN